MSFNDTLRKLTDEAIHTSLTEIEAEFQRRFGQAESGWIDWAGGECPVAHSEMVQLRTRDASYSPFNASPAGDWDFCEPSCWADNGFKDDIIAYRVVQS